MDLTLSVPSEKIQNRLHNLGDDVEMIVWNFQSPQPERHIDLAVFPFPPEPEAMKLLGEVDHERVSAVQSQTLGYEGIADILPAGITYCNAVGVHEGATAELVMGLILASRRNIDAAACAMQTGAWGWSESQGLRDATVLLVGYGGIGMALERRLAGFETTIVRCASRARLEDTGYVHSIDELERLLPDSDIVVVAVPLSAATERMIDSDFLGAMKPGALIVNISRGRVADSDALVRHAESGHVRVALDVTAPEPLPSEHPLWKTPGVLITPHVGGSVSSMHSRVDRIIKDQLDNLRNQRPLANVVIQ